MSSLSTRDGGHPKPDLQEPDQPVDDRGDVVQKAGAVEGDAEWPGDRLSDGQDRVDRLRRSGM